MNCLPAPFFVYLSVIENRENKMYTLKQEKELVANQISELIQENIDDEETRTAEMLRDVIKFCKHLRMTDF